MNEQLKTSRAGPVVAVLISLIFFAEPVAAFTLIIGAIITGSAVVSELSPEQRNPGKNAEK